MHPIHRRLVSTLWLAASLSLAAVACSVGAPLPEPDFLVPGGDAEAPDAGAAGAAGAAGSADAHAGAGGGAGGAGGQAGSGGADAAPPVEAGPGGAAGAGGATSGAPTAPYPAYQETGDIAAGIAHLDEYRAALSLSQVTLDAASSTGCEGHLDYLIWEAQKTGQNTLRHDEPDKLNPYYSPSNEQAGKDSDIAWGQDQNGGQSFGAAVDVWINGLYHRHPLLDPGLVKVGAASKQGYNCLNYRAPGNTVAVRAAAPVLWPADGMTDVPRTFVGNEGPCPTSPSNPLGTTQGCAPGGFIPSAVFYGWGSYSQSAFDSVSSVTLTDVSTSAQVALLAWFADGIAGHDPAHGYVADEIALVPQASLGTNVTYRVDVDAVVSGEPTKLSWRFTTGARDE